jgi:hypothetical protein
MGGKNDNSNANVFESQNHDGEDATYNGMDNKLKTVNNLKMMMMIELMNTSVPIYLK